MLILSIIAASVVDLPLPVGPVMRTSPWESFVSSVKIGGRPQSSRDGNSNGTRLKTAESVATLLTHKVREEISRDWMARAGALFLMPAFKRVRAEIDWEEFGAAPLLGVNGVCFIGHGASRARAFRSAIRTLSRFVEQRVNDHIREEIESDRDSAA